MKKTISVPLLLVAICMSVASKADTLRVCTYNLLNYGNSANPIGYKNARLRPILQQIAPSIQCFNEVASSGSGLLDSLAKVFPAAVEHGKEHNTTKQNQFSGLFWKQGKFRLLWDSIICTEVRDIVAYDLYWDCPGLGVTYDTVKLKVITAHLKASNTSADAITRDKETQTIEAYLQGAMPWGNVILMGDLNLYSSNEQAFVNLYNPRWPYSFELNDPANRLGDWDNDASFADVHTQATRTSSLPDGGASGGLDSRFDLILASTSVIKGTKGIKYIPGSYTAFGNDGQHYGKAITSLPTNTVVSAPMAQALYEMSDHLPVYADLEFTELPLLPNAITHTGYNTWEDVVVQNPFSKTIELNVGPDIAGQKVTYHLLTVEGKEILTGRVDGKTTSIPTPGMDAGLYMLYMKTTSGVSKCYKLVHF